MWFLDDGTIVGMREDLLKVLQLLEDEGRANGLLLNHSKSLVWCGNDEPLNNDPLGYGVPRAAKNGLVILGAPVGDVTLTRRANRQDFCHL
jgi:hypothetical protein